MAAWIRPVRDTPPPLGVADGLSLLVVVGSLVALHAYCVIDVRPPADLGHYYRALPQLVAVLEQGGPGSELGRALGEQGGAYNLFLAGLMHVFGAREEVLDIVEHAWLALLLVGTWGTARALGGRAAGLAAVALAAMLPIFQVGARTHWLHFVEAAAVTGVLWPWALDPGLERWRTRLALALAAAFCLSLRTTGLIYLGSMLALSALVVGWGERRRLVLPLVGMASGLLVLLPQLGDYVAGKLAVRTVYLATVRPLLPSLAEQTFMGPGIVLLVGLALAVLLRWRVLRTAPGLLLLAWAAGCLLLGGAFHVGIDNFPLLFVAAAVLAGLGLSRLPGRPALAVVAVAGAAVALAAPFLPPPRVRPLVPVLSPAIASFESFHFLRPQSRALRVSSLTPLIEQVCTDDDGICTLLSTSGLFNLNREDDASLALFLAGVRGVKVFNAGQWWTPDDLTADDALEGLVVMECRQLGAVLTSFLEREHAVAALAQAAQVEEVGEVGPPAPCPQSWYRFESADSRKEVLDFARGYAWQVHVLPPELPPLRPHRPNRKGSP